MENNKTIMGRVWLNGGTDFQQRVPKPSQHNMAQVFEAIFDPMNGDIYNTFVDTLVNRIGNDIVHSDTWENPLGVFRKSLSFGHTVAEHAFSWIKGHAYDDAAQDLLKMSRPEIAQVFHSLNRKGRYDISIVYDELREACNNEFGLNKFVAGILNVPVNSDNWDEYLYCMQAIREYQDNWGFYNVQISAAPTTEASAKELVTKIRAMAGQFAFPSTLYNAGLFENIPVFEKDKSKLVLLTTPEVNAILDVEVLANAFNMSKGEIPYRIIEVDQMPIKGVYALLTTEDFFVIQDYVYQNTSFFDPATLKENHFLHHWEIVSASPFVPAVTFGTAADTSVATITQAVTGLTLSAAGSATSIEAGGELQLIPELTGTITANNLGIEVAPDSVLYAISAYAEPDEGEAYGEPIQLNARTRIDDKNVLHVQKTGLESGSVLVITAVSTYIDPDGTVAAPSATLTLEIA